MTFDPEHGDPAVRIVDDHAGQADAALDDAHETSSLEHLVAHPHIWRAREMASERPVLGTGHEALDRVLPGGGWPRDAITEIFLDRYGIGELSLLMPALAVLSHEERWIVWVDPPFIPYAPALARFGIDLDRLLLVHAKREALWAVEQALRSESSIAVLAWLDRANDKALRRLQLAAEERLCWAVLFRPLEALHERSPAALRMQLSREEGQIRLDILKCRGRRPGVVKLCS